MQKEVTRLLKRASVEELNKNFTECVEIYNIIGGLYSEIGSHEEAVYYHEKALESSKTIGDSLKVAVTFRYIGEAKAALCLFNEAIDYIGKYYKLAKNSGDRVELQRAWTTLGRVHLMYAQDMKDKSDIITEQISKTAEDADKYFQKALDLARSIRDEVDIKELAQMKSGLLINLGLVKDLRGLSFESIEKLTEAVTICKGYKLREDLFRCHIILTGIFRQQDDMISKAVIASEEAFNVAKSIGKKLLICDALVEKGFVKIQQRDFKGAKRMFAQAYLEKSPDESEHHKAIRLTKLAHLMCETFNKIAEDKTASATRMELCDKMGDLLVAVDCYKLAIDFYKRALNNAKVCSRPKSDLANILYSLAETYADDKQFAKALKCYEAELRCRDGNNKEQCRTLVKMALMHDYTKNEHEYNVEEVCTIYEDALKKADENPKLVLEVLRNYVPYMEKKLCDPMRRAELKSKLEHLELLEQDTDLAVASDEDEEDSSGDFEDQVGDIDEIITDEEDNDEAVTLARGRAKRLKKKQFRVNEVGDTPLHEACIKGDLRRVRLLIEQGHEVNPRDNAGWVPLHEACNHGHYEIAKYLIDHGADVNKRGLKGMSPLHDAATNGHYEIMRLLMKNGANVIALTDSGETVLNCLREYRRRNYDQMSNSESNEYKQMEGELLSHMDKCGFNLMQSTMRVASVNSASSSKVKCRPTTAADIRGLSSNSAKTLKATGSDPIKEYRDAMSTLKKRKRPTEDSQTSSSVGSVSSRSAADLPATFESCMSTSAPTKSWLVDDVSRQRDKRLRIIDDDDFDEEDDGEVVELFD